MHKFTYMHTNTGEILTLTGWMKVFGVLDDVSRMLDMKTDAMMKKVWKEKKTASKKSLVM